MIEQPNRQTTKIKAVCSQSSGVHRLERDGMVVGFALALSAGGWFLTDLDEKPLTAYAFPNPKAVAAAADRRGMGL